MPVSKPFNQYVQKQSNCEIVVIDEGDLWRDPTLKATQMISCNDEEFCTAILNSLYTKNGQRKSLVEEMADN